MKFFELAQVKYGEFHSAITSKISSILGGNAVGFGSNTIFGQLLNVMESVVQNILLYIEDAATEQNKLTASRRKSVYGLAQLSGYQPSLGKAAGCNVFIAFKPTSIINSNVIIPNHTKLICSKNGILYNLILPQESIYMSVEKDNSEKYLYAVEGRFENQSFTAIGGELYTRNVEVKGDIDLDYFELTVNQEKWERADSLYDMDTYGKQYVVRVNANSGIDIVFGNNQHGLAIKDGDYVEINYLIHTGILGNFDTDTDVYFNFKDKLTNVIGEEVDGNNLFVIKADLSSNVSSGTNSETAMEVKEMIGYNSRSFCLSDPKNYKVYINRFSFCGYNRTWCEEGSLVVNSLIMENYTNKVRSSQDYFNLHESDFILSSAQKRAITDSISNSGQQLAGSVYNIFDPVICKYALYLYVTLKDSAYDQVSVETSIRSLVGEFFCNINSDIFIPKSDIIHLLKSKIDEIDSIDAYFLSEKNEKALKNGYYKVPSKRFNLVTQKYEKYDEVVYLYPGEDPGLGLDEHGNIYLDNDVEFPVLMGGWSYLTKTNENTWDKAEGSISNPLIIVFK